MFNLPPLAGRPGHCTAGQWAVDSWMVDSCSVAHCSSLTARSSLLRCSVIISSESTAPLPSGALIVIAASWRPLYNSPVAVNIRPLPARRPLPSIISCLLSLLTFSISSPNASLICFFRYNLLTPAESHFPRRQRIPSIPTCELSFLLRRQHNAFHCQPFPSGPSGRPHFPARAAHRVDCLTSFSGRS